MVDVLLDLVVETDPLPYSAMYQIFVYTHLLREVQGQPVFLQKVANALALVEDLAICLIDVHLGVYIDLFVLRNRPLLLCKTPHVAH